MGTAFCRKWPTFINNPGLWQIVDKFFRVSAPCLAKMRGSSQKLEFEALQLSKN